MSHSQLPSKIGTENLLSESHYDAVYEEHLNWPRISIVTPSFNQGKYIETTIRSILLQNYPNLEYIIIDGGSTDETVDIIKRYDDQIAYWVSEPDKGQSEAINKGIAKATGEIFNWINSDDWLEPNAFKCIASLFMKHKADAVGTRSNIMQDGKLQWVNSFTPKHDDWKTSAWTRGLNQQGLFFRTEHIKSMGGVDVKYNFSMDLDLWVRFLLIFGQDNYYTDDTITTNFRIHGECKSGMEGWGSGSASDIETKAMRFRLAAKLDDPRYFAGLKYLFPDYKADLAQIPISSNIPKNRIGEWLNHKLYMEMRSAFYATDFKKTIVLAESINPDFLNAEQTKNHRSFLRYSKMENHLVGRWVKSLLKR